MKLLTRPPPASAGSARQGTRALAAMVFVGIALPPLGALLKPFVPEAVFALLLLAFLRVEPAALRGHVEQAGLVIAASRLWTMIALPALLCGGYLAARARPAMSPDLYLALILQAAASPLMSSPAIAALLGLDAALVLATMIVCTALDAVHRAGFHARLSSGRRFILSPLAARPQTVPDAGGRRPARCR